MLKWPCPNLGKNSLRYQFISKSQWENRKSAIYYPVFVVPPVKLILMLENLTQKCMRLTCFKLNHKLSGVEGAEQFNSVSFYKFLQLFVLFSQTIE